MKKYKIKPIKNNYQVFHNCANLKKSEACLANLSNNSNEKWSGCFSITPRTGKSKHGEQVIFQFSPSILMCTEKIKGKQKSFEFYEDLITGRNHMKYVVDYIDKMKKSKEEMIADRWREILELIGEDPDREGLKDTPKRIAKMYKEIFRGYDESQKPIVTCFKNGSDGLVCDELISDEGKFYSFCEHHVIPFGFGKYVFAYIPHPKGKILGLSKVARVVDYFSAKLQIQERLVNDIIEYLWEELSKDTKYPPLGMGLYMDAMHLCKVMRGVKKEGKMTTMKLKGNFKNQNETRQEFLRIIK